MTVEVVCPVLPELLVLDVALKEPTPLVCQCRWPVLAGPKSFDEALANRKSRGLRRLHTPDSPVVLWLNDRKWRPRPLAYPNHLMLLEVDTSAGKFLLKPKHSRVYAWPEPEMMQSAKWCPPQPEDPRWLHNLFRLHAADWVGSQHLDRQWVWKVRYNRPLFGGPNNVEFMYAYPGNGIPEGRGLPGSPSKFVDDISATILTRTLCLDCWQRADLPLDFEPSAEDIALLQKVSAVALG